MSRNRALPWSDPHQVWGGLFTQHRSIARRYGLRHLLTVFAGTREDHLVLGELLAEGMTEQEVRPANIPRVDRRHDEGCDPGLRRLIELRLVARRLIRALEAGREREGVHPQGGRKESFRTAAIITLTLSAVPPEIFQTTARTRPWTRGTSLPR